MKSRSITTLANYLDRSISDSRLPCFITKMEIVAISGSDLETCREWLEKWQRKGNLKILKDLRFSEDGEHCVELIKYNPEWDTDS